MGQPVGGEPETKGAELLLALRTWLRVGGPRLRPRGWVALGLGAVALAALLLALSVGAYELSLAREDEVWARIQARRIFTVATDASYPPFAAVDADGNLFGFDIDLAEALGQRWGVKVEFEMISFDALLGSVISLRDDAVISAFVPQPERMKEVTFSRPYFTGGAVAIVRKGMEGAAGGADWPASLAGQTVAVERGAAGDALAREWARQLARKSGALAILAQPTAEEALLSVENGAAALALADRVDGYNFMRGHPTVTMILPPVAPEPYTVAVSIRSRVLAQEIEQALQAMESDGTLTALRVKWFGEAAR